MSKSLDNARKYKCILVHLNKETEAKFKRFLSMNKKAIDTDNSDVYIKHTTYELFMEGKKSTKFDFVVVNWKDDSARPNIYDETHD